MFRRKQGELDIKNDFGVVMATAPQDRGRRKNRKRLIFFMGIEGYRTDNLYK